MGDILASIYPWTKSMHVISIIAWMAGLFYLPRLYVRHTESVTQGTETDLLFQDMEKKLLKMIMNPAMISSWFFGLCLVFTPGIVDWSAGWSWIKAANVLGMTWFHMWCAARRKDFITGTNTRSGRHYRMMNELPTLFMIFIVVMIIAKPF
ncbi:protoporphyrinogen oxidase HemJ [Celeribacter sp. HF31]|uniref:protoporphyrinogen oxidase HemJ n=1 Tax=Celeribacter sp. HF31 TaxID=2721558 RepID=UPI001430A9F5|nr:protoporphyrinogen oxidase HemJ [Celeribacter sp. HF31]NIY79370.1 protoporphyrinogen oxidase HemJ [Celeribacter sp. HF31]